MTTFTDLIAPTVNLNGSPREALLDQKRAILDVLVDLKEVLSRSAPHGRDYQLAADPDASWSRDRAIYHARYKLIDDLQEAIQQEALALIKDSI